MTVTGTLLTERTTLEKIASAFLGSRNSSDPPPLLTTLGTGQPKFKSTSGKPLLAEIKRYGPYTRAGETVYDRPFLWGTKRTGPDLQRIGGKYSDLWHRLHMINPRDVVTNSIMPAYPWLAERAANADADIQLKMRVLRRLGHPYTDDEIEAAPGTLEGLMEIDALIAYLQVLGTSRGPGDTP